MLSPSIDAAAEPAALLTLAKIRSPSRPSFTTERRGSRRYAADFQDFYLGFYLFLPDASAFVLGSHKRWRLTPTEYQ
jgi:hypothetical protein